MCKASFGFYFEPTSGACGLCTIAGYYKNDTDRICTKCSNRCKTCTGQATYCLSCYSTSLYPYLQSNNCVTACLGATYADNLTYTCKPCPANCLECTSQDVCTKCLAGKYKYLTKCYDICPTNQALYNNNTDYTCRNCPGWCSACSNPDQCTACSSGFTALSGVYCVCSAADQFLKVVTFQDYSCVSACGDGKCLPHAVHTCTHGPQPPADTH